MTGEIKDLFHDLEKATVRNLVLDKQYRVDGRGLTDVRPISIMTGYLPRVHGSAIFTRGETQALVTATLGTSADEQKMDSLEFKGSKSFLLHYNFPAFCTGEVKFISGPGRREIGHGMLAERSLIPILPNKDVFPYTIRIVSEILESNGSSSMASVCGGSLSMMDAGIPIKAPVAGIAMGLVKEGERFAVLSDILGDEDHLGDMDFKVAGSANGITALQMDIKIEGITEEIMEVALNQAFAGRMHILNEMNKVISRARAEISAHAPTFEVININPDKIRDVIGKGGATIRQITEETKAAIDIEDNGTVRVFGETKAAAKAAIAKIQAITAEVEPGTIYAGKVIRIVEFGAFVNILPGTDGLLHISQISNERIANVTDVLKEGQEVKVQVADVDNRGRIKLTMKDIEQA